jgi:hypothetical protein
MTTIAWTALAAIAAATIAAIAIHQAIWFTWRYARARNLRRHTRWYELHPQGTRPTPERIGAAVAAWIGSTSNQRTGAVTLIRDQTDGVLTDLIAVHKHPNSGAVAAQYAAAVGGVATETTAPISIPAQWPVAVAWRDAFNPLNPTEVESPGAFAGWLADRFTPTRAGRFVVTAAPIRKWEQRRLRAFLMLDERSSAGAASIIGGTVGTATAQNTSGRQMRIRVAAAAPEPEIVDTVVTGFTEWLDGFAQTVYARARNPHWIDTIWITSTAAATIALWFTHGPTAAIVAASAAAIITGAWFTLNPPAHAIHHWVSRAVLPPPRAWWLNPRWIGSGWVRATSRDQDPTETKKQGGVRAAHPHPLDVLIASPIQFGALGGFPPELSGNVHAASATALPCPPAVADPTSGKRPKVALGDTIDDRPAWIADPDRQWGVFAVGDPGAGKTTLSVNLFGADLAVTMHTKRHRPQIWIESKGDGASRAVAAAEHAGVDPRWVYQINAAEAAGIHLNLFDPDTPTAICANQFVDAMRYAFDDGDIAERSADVLRGALTIAVAANRTGFGPNPVRAAFWVLGGDPDLDAAKDFRAQLAGAMANTGDDYHTQFAQSHNTDPLTDAVRAFARYQHPHLSTRDQTQVFLAPLNKLAGLLAAEVFLDPAGRPEVTFASILTQGAPCVINFGASTPGAPRLTSGLAERMGALMLWLLWEQIQQTCDSWQASGRSVGVYSDELADLVGTGTGTDVVAQMVDQGRSRGVQLVFATQRPAQLPDRTRDAVMGFGSRVWFRVSNVTIASEAVADLTGLTAGAQLERPGPVSERDLRQLNQRQAVCLTRVDGRLQAPFTLEVPPDPQTPRFVL